PDDVLADVVHVALHRGQQDLALGLDVVALLACLDVGQQPGHGLLHHPGAFDHLRQKHLATAEQVAHHVHAVHQRPFDHVDGLVVLQPRFLGVFLDVAGDALDQRVGDARLHIGIAPAQILEVLGIAAGGVVRRDLHQTVGAIGAAVEDDVFHPLLELGGDLVIDGQLPGVDDAHGQPRLNGVVEEHRVNRFAHGLVAAEGERHVAHAAGDQRMGQLALDVAAALDEVDGVVVVFLDAGGNGEDVRVKDDVLGRESHLVDQYVIAALTDAAFLLQGIGLAGLVEGHHHHSGAILAAQAGLLDELALAFLEADGVDDALALDALEAGLQNLPLGGIDHDRHAADVRLAGDQPQEARHGGLGVQHALVHVDVDDLGAGLHLLQGHIKRGGVVAFADEAREAARAGDVGALTDVDEERVRPDVEGLQTAQAAGGGNVGDDAGTMGRYGVGNRADVLGRGAAAAADDVEEAAAGELLDDFCHLPGALVVFAEFVGQPGVRVRGHMRVGDARDFLDMRTQLGGPQRAVEADGDGVGMGDRIPECFHRLPGQGATAGIGDGAGDHDRQGATAFSHLLLHRKDRRLGIERVEDRFDQQDVGAAGDQPIGGNLVVLHQLVEGDVAEGRVVDVRGDRCRAAGWSKDTGHEAWLVRVGTGELVTGGTGQPGTLVVQFTSQCLQLVVCLGDRCRVEGVGLDDIRPGLQIGPVNVTDNTRLGQGQQVVVAPQVLGAVLEALAPEIRLL